MKFAFIYALPGYTKEELNIVETELATFYAIAVDINNKESAANAALFLLEKYSVEMIELCGGLGNAHIVSLVKKAINDKVPVGAVYYGPESRRPLVDLLKL